MQQCRRPQIKEWIRTNNPDAFVANDHTLRRKVKAFALNSKHETIKDYKNNFEKILPGENSWTDYWEKMGQTGTWVDSSFVQVAAWFIRLDILILTTSSKIENPFIRINGNIESQDEATSEPHMLLGNYTNVHYQSLLPLYKNKIQSSKKVSETEMNAENDSKRDDYIFIHNGDQIVFLSKENENLQCPFCYKAFQKIVNHLRNMKCEISKLNIDTVEFTSQLNSYKEGFRLEFGRRWKQKSRTKLTKERGEKAMKDDDKKHKTKNRAKGLVERGKEAINKEQALWKMKSREKLTAERGEKAMKDDDKKRKQKSQEKLTAERGKKAMKEDQSKSKVKSRNKMRVEKGPQRIQDAQNAWKLQSRKRKLDEDPGSVHINESKRKKLSREKQRK